MARSSSFAALLLLAWAPTAAGFAPGVAKLSSASVAAGQGLLCRTGGSRSQTLSHGLRNKGRIAGQGTARWGQAVAGVVELKDKATGVSVFVVGAMHYNPVSVRRARAVTSTLAENGLLSAVVVESCPTRWERSRPADQAEWITKLMSSEMHAASDEADAVGAAVVLGDQKIEDLTVRAKSLLQETGRDLVSPLSGGWQRMGADVATAFTKCFPKDAKDGAKQLGASDIFDLPLLAAMPISFARYPLAWLVRAPKGAATFALLIIAVSAVPELAASVGIAAGEAAGGDELIAQIVAGAGGLAFSVVETVVLARLMLVALLSDRNEILAASIRGACERAMKAPAGPDGVAKSVVAVLGMAHVNGVASLLNEAVISVEDSSKLAKASK